jgi:hypothetical protein
MPAIIAIAIENRGLGPLLQGALQQLKIFATPF